MKKLILPMLLLTAYALPAHALTMRGAALVALEHSPRMLSTPRHVDASGSVNEPAA